MVKKKTTKKTSKPDFSSMEFLESCFSFLEQEKNEADIKLNNAYDEMQEIKKKLVELSVREATLRDLEDSLMTKSEVISDTLTYLGDTINCYRKTKES